MSPAATRFAAVGLAAATLLVASCSATPSVPANQAATDPVVTTRSGTTQGTTASVGTTPVTAVRSGSVPRSTIAGSAPPGSARTRGSAIPPSTSPPTPQFAAWCTRLYDFITESSMSDVALEDWDNALQALKQRYQELADSAPAPIAADWAVLNRAAQAMTLEAMLASTTTTPDPGYAEAGARVAVWTEENCAFDPNG